MEKSGWPTDVFAAHHLQGEVIGELFDESVRVDVSHDPENLRFGFQGQMAADDIFYLADMQPNSVLSGEDYLEES